MRGRNGSMPDISEDDDADTLSPREASGRIRALERNAREQAETQGEILAGIARLETRVSKLRSKTWTAKEWATLLAAVAAAVTATGTVLAHFLGK